MANKTVDSLTFGDKYVFTLPYGVCSTAAATAAKVVTIDNFGDLVTGAMVAVKFNETNSVDNPTLNVNSTGAKNIYYNGAAISKAYLCVNRVFLFVYNGTQWEFLGEKNVNSTSTVGASNTTDKIFLVGAKTQGNGYTSYSNVNCYASGGYLYSNGTKVSVEGHTHSYSTTDTKNTAGSTDSSSKLFLIGATSQAANPQTYSHNTAYVGTDGCLYSNSTKVSVEGHTHSYSTTDTKNTAGSTNTTSKIFLVGPTSQAASAQTYSNSGCYASGGYLYSNSTKVSVEGHTHSYAASSHAHNTVYTAVPVTTTWSGSGPYTQTITSNVSGIAATDIPMVDLDCSSYTTVAQVTAGEAEFAKIYRVVTAANSITVYATEKTTSAIKIRLKVFK